MNAFKPDIMIGYATLSAKDMENVSFEIEESEDLAVDPRTGKFPLVARENLKSVQ